VGKVFDSGGTTLLQTVKATTTLIASGGIAFKATGAHAKYWDSVQVAGGVNLPTSPAAAVVAASRAAPAATDTPAASPDGSTAATGLPREAATVLPRFVPPAQSPDILDRLAAPATAAGPAWPESGSGPSARGPLDANLVDACFTLSDQRP